ncbi:hypothetical protein BDV97DRAFT_395239 [Delphinella strobiligena]|nr:hypothetical protein BDV97DRAFT_395239 [Delphinella strobiligena]
MVDQPDAARYADLDAKRGDYHWDLDQDALSHFDVSGLLKEGFINGTAPMLSSPYLDHRDIHVVFSRNNWIDPTTNGPISATDYELISPVLRLASEFLDHPRIIPFFSGLLRRPLLMFNHPKFSHPLTRFMTDSTMTDPDFLTQSTLTWKRLQTMHECIEFQFGGTQPGTHARTRSNGRNGLHPGTCGTRINIDMMYLDILRGRYNAHDCPWAQKLQVDLASAILRTQLQLAIALTHEFSHALTLAYTEQRPSSTWHDPFLANNRLSEVGWAYEQTIFSGIYEAINSRNRPFAKTMPYGMCARPFPGTLRPPNAASLELRGPFEAGVRRDYEVSS